MMAQSYIKFIIRLFINFRAFSGCFVFSGCLVLLLSCYLLGSCLNSVFGCVTLYFNSLIL